MTGPGAEREMVVAHNEQTVRVNELISSGVLQGLGLTRVSVTGQGFSATVLCSNELRKRQKRAR